MAKVLRLHEYTGVGGIRLDDIPVSEPGQNEVRINVDAFSLNYGDFELFENKYVFSMDLPARFGDECAGVIDAIGPGVSGFKVGDKVCTLPWMNEGYGVNGAFAIVPADFVARYPDNLSVEEACSVWVAYMTAYFALFDISKIKAGDHVLITAASSSSGLAAMEICKMVGAYTIGTSRTHNNDEFLLDAGFDHVIAQSDYEMGDGKMASTIMELTAGKGVNVAYDPIGGPILRDYAYALAQNPQVIIYGNMDPRPTVLPEIVLTQKRAFIRSYSVYQFIYAKEAREQGIRFCYDALKSGKLKAYFEKVFPIEDFRQAFEHQKSASTRRGKILISATRRD